MTPTHASKPLAAMIAGATLVAVGSVWSAPDVFMVDDAWFYLQIAGNLRDHGWSTFDGLTTTDGYHPLWMALLTGLISPFDSPSARLTAAVAAQIGFALVALPMLRNLAIKARFAFPEVVVVTLLLTQFTDKGWMTEGPLTALLHVAVLSCWIRNHAVWTGIFMGLLFLCRLDTVFFLGLLTVVSPARDRVKLVLAAAVVAVPWVAGHAWWMGHLVPVSGALKSTFPVPDLSDPLAKVGWTGAAAIAGSALACASAWRDTESARRRLLLAVGGGGLLHGVYVTLFTGPRWSTFVAYYWITGLLATGFLLGRVLGVYLDLLPSLPPRRRRQIALGIAGFIAIAGSIRNVRSAVLIQQTPDPVPLLAEQVKATLPNARILVLDAPGRLAWFSGRPVIAMDGLTQAHTFSDEVRQEGMATWMANHGVTHVLTYAVPFDAPWCSVRTDGEVVDVTFLAPDTREPVGTHRFEGAPLMRLTDFRDDDINWASLYAWP